MCPAEISRINGAKSFGPATAEGKAISSQNALKHGIFSKQVVLPGEDAEAFERLRADYIRRFRPQGDAEQELVETIAASSWRLKRIMRIENALFDDENTDALKALGLLVRYENQLNRTYDQSVRRVKELQENRPKEIVRNEPNKSQRIDAGSSDQRPNAPISPLRYTEDTGDVAQMDRAVAS